MSTTAQGCRVIQVVCIDDNQDILTWLRLSMNRERDLRCNWVEPSADALIAHLETLPSNELPNVIVLDWSMPGMSAAEAIRTVGERWPECRVLVYSAHGIPSVRDEAYDAGAWGFVCKTKGFDALLEGVRQVARGEVVMDME